jgi:hypothetical protein
LVLESQLDRRSVRRIAGATAKPAGRIFAISKQACGPHPKGRATKLGHTPSGLPRPGLSASGRLLCLIVPGDFLVRSNVGDDQLRVWATRPGGYWRARLAFADLTAEGKVSERSSRDELHLDAYFADLAAKWRGWEGKKHWEALGLALAARHDGLGHVTLDVTLQHDYAAVDPWQVRASLALDAGALDRLALEARELDRWSGSA